MKKLIKSVLSTVIVTCLMVTAVFAADVAPDANKLTSANIMKDAKTGALTCQKYPGLIPYVTDSKPSAGDFVTFSGTLGSTNTPISVYIESANYGSVNSILNSAGVVKDNTDENAKKVNEILDNSKLEANVIDAAAILAPAIPYINIGLGIALSVLLAAMTIFTTADICFLALPVFRTKCDDAKQSGENSLLSKKTPNGGMKLRFVSDEAVWAIENSTQNQSSPWGKYLKSRIMSYIFLAIVIYILLTGNISIITNLALKLVSGIMNVLTGLG